MRYYAVIDTNVLVSAMLKTASVPTQVMAKALNGDIIPILPNDILVEYEEVLKRPKFKFNPPTVKVFWDELKRRAVYVDATFIEEMLPDEKYIVFYAVLMEARKEEEAYLVMGNLRHFSVRTYIVTPREMLDILREAKKYPPVLSNYAGRKIKIFAIAS